MKKSLTLYAHLNKISTSSWLEMFNLFRGGIPWQQRKKLRRRLQRKLRKLPRKKRSNAVKISAKKASPTRGFFVYYAVAVLEQRKIFRDSPPLKDQAIGAMLAAIASAGASKKSIK